jgi:hypothetical protein
MSVFIGLQGQCRLCRRVVTIYVNREPGPVKAECQCGHTATIPEDHPRVARARGLLVALLSGSPEAKKEWSDRHAVTPPEAPKKSRSRKSRA